MAAKIAVIYSHYPELADVAEELRRHKGYEVEVRVAIFEEAVKIARECERRGFDVIVSRGATGVLMQRSVSVPVVLVEITNFDIMRSLHQARQLGRRLAYFDYVHRYNGHEFDAIREIMGLGEDELHAYFYQNEEELREQVARAAAAGREVVVGTGAFVLGMAEGLGLKGVMVRSSREAIYRAFSQAEDIVAVRERERRVSDYLAAVIENLSVGVVLVDKEGRITHLNPLAGQLLGVKDAVGKELRELHVPELTSVLTGAPTSVLRVGSDRLVLANRVDLRCERATLGQAIMLEDLQRIQAVEARVRKEHFAQGFVARYRFADIVGEALALRETVKKAQSFALSNSTVVITGETGTGKEMFAHSIHNASARADGPFVAVNCATLPDTLLESELFGYEEGSFTGAKKGGKPGLFELAHGGTIFLDEISEIGPDIQVLLLRVLQERVIRRVGGRKVIPVDVRVIVATNADLAQKVRAGTFREDLYFRLNVLNLRVPPLRERREDIPLLFKYFLGKCGCGHLFSRVPEVFLHRLKNYPWPGNVRELESFVERFAVLSASDPDPFHLLEELYHDLVLFEESATSAAPHTLLVQEGPLEDMELEIIEKMYRRYGSDKARLAKMLGISRTSLWSKLKKIDQRREQAPPSV